ncbi:hypothetical protein NQD76_25485, partial [Escherichia coli]|nr:hypothetical protein [Escherichia coli]
RSNTDGCRQFGCFGPAGYGNQHHSDIADIGRGAASCGSSSGDAYRGMGRRADRRIVRARTWQVGCPTRREGSYALCAPRHSG